MRSNLLLAVMVVRTPGSRKDAAEMVGRMIQIRNYATGVHDRAFNSLVHRIEQGEGRQLTEESRTSLRRSLIDPSGYRLELGKEWALQHLTAADKLTPVLFQMRWRTIGAAQGFFITSDDPVVRWVEPKTWHPIYGDHGYLNKTAVVTFPFTPKVMLAMSWEDEGANAFAGRRGVDRLNRLRALQAD